MLGYTSASACPAKLLHYLRYISLGSPVHLQVNPTNKCNMNCKFCSCKGVDRTEELPFDVLSEEIRKFKGMGGQAVTITGGGEPLLYGGFDDILELCRSLGLKIGLATNGLLLNRVENLSMLSWCRISANNGIRTDLDKIVEKNKTVDWSFSFVYTGGEEREIQKCINFANTNGMSHLRIVNDILNPISIPKFRDDERVIYQDRTSYSHGAKKCYLSLIKPYLNADGYYYPCCGVQYAILGQSYKMLDSMRIGKGIDSLRIFDGSLCDRCYYNHYNDIANKYMGDIKHLEFI